MRFGWLVPLLLAGCDARQPEPACGESFCLPADARLVREQAGADGAALYDVAWRGAEFTIHEGNRRSMLDGARYGLRLRIDEQASLRIKDGLGSVTMKTGLERPSHVDVRGACTTLDDCPAAALAAS